MKKILLGLSLLLMLATACRRETPEEPAPKSPLPPETQTGANTFGCYINGAPWTPVSDMWMLPRLSMQYDIDKALTLTTRRSSDKEDSGMTLFSMPVNSVGLYEIRKGGNTSSMFYNNKVSYLAYSFDADVVESGTLTITRFDIPNGIISGRFEFTLKKQGHPEVKVTAGRFDCKM